MINVYTIVVTFNSMKWIDKCITSLNHSSLHSEIVVVDNCSTDETVNHISSQYSYVHLIVNENNKGFGQANNQGIEYAYKHGATHFFLCNQDLYVMQNTIEELVRIQSQNKISIVSPLQLNGDFSSLDSGFYNNISDNETFRELVCDLFLNKTQDFYNVSFVPAAAWMIDKNTISAIGGFDPLFFHYGEDLNYSQRLKFHGMKMAIVTTAKAGHDRVFKGNLKAFNRYYHQTVLINAFADPSDPLLLPIYKRIRVCGFVIRDIFKSLFQLRFKRFILLSSSFFKFLTHLKAIVYSVKCNRTLNSHWLNI